MDSITRVRGSADPIAYQRGDWEVVEEANGRRWFGPDTLLACLEAQRAIEPILRSADMAQA